MFLIAVFFCIEVAHIASRLHAVDDFFQKSDEQREEALSQSYPDLFRTRWGRQSWRFVAYIRAQTSMVGRAATFKARRRTAVLATTVAAVVHR